MTERLPRMQRDALDREDAHYLRKPLTDQRSASAHARHMAKLLRSKRSASPCADAIAYILTVLDLTMAKGIPQQSWEYIACKKGCAHCCTQPVGITVAEAFYLARTVRHHEEVVAAIKEAGLRIKAAPEAKRLFNMRCPLLRENSCSAYSARPLSCRTYLSFNVNSCITKYVMTGAGGVPGPAEIEPIRNGCLRVLFIALGIAGRDDFTTTYEMKAALSHLLELGDDAEERWLAGEDIMAGVSKLPDIDPAILWDITSAVRQLRPTL